MLKYTAAPAPAGAQPAAAHLCAHVVDAADVERGAVGLVPAAAAGGGVLVGRPALLRSGGEGRDWRDERCAQGDERRCKLVDRGHSSCSTARPTRPPKPASTEQCPKTRTANEQPAGGLGPLGTSSPLGDGAAGSSPATDDSCRMIERQLTSLAPSRTGAAPSASEDGSSSYASSSSPVALVLQL